MHIKFLLWNLQRGRGRRLDQSLARLTAIGIDVFIFVEAPADPTMMLSALNTTTPNLYATVSNASQRVRFVFRQEGALSGAVWKDRYSDGDNDRIAAVELQPPGVLSMLLVGAHLDSRSTGISKEGQAEWAREAAQEIRLVEKDANHQRTIFVGDLNMNPFDAGLIETSALHAVMSRKLASAVSRHSARRHFPVFYNPMWSCFSDRPAHQGHEMSRSPGTHYYNNTNDRANSFWQMYDQVLLRPALMNRLTRLEILDHDGVENLVTHGGQPRRNSISDHLPVLFELNL